MHFIHINIDIPSGWITHEEWMSWSTLEIEACIMHFTILVNVAIVYLIK